MRTRRGWILLVVLALPAMTLAAGAARGEGPAGGAVTVDESQVYFGNPARFKQAGEICCDDVFRAIPEYRKIIEEGLKEGVRYDFLLLRANEKFRKALRNVSKSKGFDLIAEIGAVRIEGKTVPDITQVVIDALPE